MSEDIVSTLSVRRDEIRKAPDGWVDGRNERRVRAIGRRMGGLKLTYRWAS